MSEEIAIRGEDSPALPVTFQLLGAFRLTTGGRTEPPGPGQVQRLLVKLLAAKAAPVANDELMGAVWDEVPGPGATAESLHHLVGVARRRLVSAGLTDVLINGRGTYRLDVPPELVDVHQFHALTARARELARGGDEAAVTLFERALRLRRGEPLAGLPGGWIDGYRQTLVRELVRAEKAFYETAIRSGQAGERLPGLSALYRERPADERVTWLYMHALHRAGQSAEALLVRRDFAAHLVDAHGLDCGKAVDDLYLRIMNNDASLLMPEAVSFPEDGPGVRPVGPGSQNPHAREQEQEQEQEQDAEAGEPSAGRDDTAARGPAVESPRGTPDPTVSNVFYERVDARHAVFGPQIVYGPPR